MTTVLKARKALKVLKKRTSLSITTNQIECLLLLYAAGDTGISKAEVADEIDITPAAAGKLIDKMTGTGSTTLKADGWGIVEIRVSPPSVRSPTIAVLNEEGRSIVKEYLDALS